MSEPNTNQPEPPATTTAAVQTPAVPAKPAPPPKVPAKPAAKKAERRFFLFTWIGIAWTTFTLSMLGMVLGTVRFLFPNVLSEPPSTFKAGDPNSYEEGKVVERYKEQNAWIVRARDDRGRDTIYALSTTCTHLGCTPNWLDADKKFKCPCHGSGFRISGVNFEGPAPRPLERWAIRVGDDGQILVDKSRKFQRELGQWDDPESFIPMG